MLLRLEIIISLQRRRNKTTLKCFGALENLFVQLYSMYTQIMRVVQQGETFAVQSQKSENGQMMKCNIVVQLGGMAYYDAKQYFLFSPQESGVNKVPRFRSMGVAQQMPDGTFDFVVQHRLRTQSELIKKLAHGRVSKTKDGAVQLTLKVFFHEGINIAQTLAVFP